jgi:hypothetical protein
VTVHARAIESDKLGHPWLSLMLVDISPNLHFTSSVQSQSLNFVTGDVKIPFQEAQNKNCTTLSSREAEILYCIEKGLSSKKNANHIKYTSPAYT